VLEYLKITTIPREVVLVNEIYLSDCMMYKYLVNPLHDRYQLDGQKSSAIIPQTPTSSESSSLPLKNNGRKFPPQTPSRTEGSDELAANRQLELLAQQVSSRRAEEASHAARTSRPQDALDKAIEEAAEVEGLPLDAEYNGLVESFSNEDDSEGDGQNSPSRLPRDFVRPASSHWQNNFSCMQKHDGLDKDTLPNARTIEVLQKMATYYERMQDKWRVLAYRKAIAALRKQPGKIATKEAARAIPGIGSRLADKIEEIALTDRLRRLDNTTVDNPDDAVLQLFLAIYGVGFTQAQTWISQGHRTLASLLESATLNANQRVGIDHYEDFLSRVPRAETEAHAAFLRKHLAAVCPTLELTVGGSYRRGATDNGDIDFLITSQTRSLSALRTLLVESLLPRLFAIRYLRTTLASCDPIKGTKWLGAACLPNVKEQIWRRVDILLVPWEEMGAALIYWTGNDIFNRSMRLLASKKGMRLNQHGLYKNVLRGPGRSKLTEGELVESASEKAIFERLGVPWRPPEHRIC
jgi:DNA polymerase IV